MPDTRITRRGFITNTVAATLIVPAATRAGAAASQTPAAREPWYRRAYLWGQTNITERDPVRYDIAWWRTQWKRTRVQALIINAGGIVAYYPSKFPLHHRAEHLNGRDLFGELHEGRARRRPVRDGAHGLESCGGGFFPGAPGLVRAQPAGRAVSSRRQVRRVHQQPGTTTHICPTSSARSSNAHTLKVSPTTVGRDSAAAASATATTAHASSRGVAAGTFLKPPTGTTRPTAMIVGTTPAVLRSGT